MSDLLRPRRRTLKEAVAYLAGMRAGVDLGLRYVERQVDAVDVLAVREELGPMLDLAETVVRDP